MRVFITGTDTNVGKTVVCSWLALHARAAYWKPIQTGNLEDSDRQTVIHLAKCLTYAESYTFRPPLAPYLAASRHRQEIDLNQILIPDSSSLIIEGAGGLMVPLNHASLMIDLIQAFNIPVILVSRSTLGTINHTCLSLEALKKREIPVLGVIMNGPFNEENCSAIEHYGQTKVLAQLPSFPLINHETLQHYPLPSALKIFL